nr:ATP synthase F1 subunit delta [uncultured Carboxylicivirga sp.]
MNRSLIANRYATALYKLASEEGNLERVNADVLLMQSYIKEAEGFEELLNSPVIKPQQKKVVLHSVLENQVDPSTMSFIDLLIANSREELLEDINRGFIQMYKEEKGIKAVTLYTAVRLGSDQEQGLVDFLRKQFNSPIELILKVDPELLGGFKLTIDGKMADASLSSKLKNMKKQLLN